MTRIWSCSVHPSTLPLEMVIPPWLDGMRDIAPSLLAISKKKNFPVHKALNDNLWIRNLA
jgi:hypothetical protein